MSETAEADPTFPPLLRGETAPAGQDPFAKAVAAAAVGADPGLVVWSRAPDGLAAALVLAPEHPLEQSLSVVFAVALGLGDALGALAPPEVAVHYDWPGGIRVNGARCGRLRAAAPGADPGAIPDWLVVGVEMPYLPPEGVEPGTRPDETSLAEEGCIDVTPVALLESWTRHSLHWIHRWMEEGMAPLHEAWRGRAWGLGEDLPEGGIFVGIDEWGGRLVRTPSGTRLDPLTALLEGA